MKALFATILACSAITPATAQLLFTSGADTSQLLFERINGQSVQIDTGVGTHDLPGLSRDGRFVTFGAPDPVAGNGLNPSGDLYLYDRSTRQTTTVVNNTTGGARTLILSSQISPDASVIAYGFEIGPAFGGAGGIPSTGMNIVDPVTRLPIQELTAGRTSNSDAFGAEFRGVSFAKDSQSFYTPVYRYIGINDPAPVELPTIVRFDRVAGTNTWQLGANVSTPSYVQTAQLGGLGRQASFHTYPALSPNDQGLAYFSVVVPDVRTSTVPWISRVALSNADGSNVRLLTEFAQGFLPTGLTWSQDGTQIIVSVSQQVVLFNNPTPSVLKSNSAVFAISVTDGTVTQLSELGSSIAPMLPGGESSGPGLDLENTPLSLSRVSGSQFLLTAQGIPANQTVSVQSATDLRNYAHLRNATGAELSAGIRVNRSGAQRFYRLAP